MKRGKGINIKLNITNRVLYTLIAVGILAVIGVGVYAYGTSDPSIFGHTISEIDGLAGVGFCYWDYSNSCPSGFSSVKSAEYKSCIGGYGGSGPQYYARSWSLMLPPGAVNCPTGVGGTSWNAVTIGTAALCCR